MCPSLRDQDKRPYATRINIDQREVSRVLVFNLSGETSGAPALRRMSLPLTEGESGGDG